MDERTFFLTLPSLAALAALVVHSWLALPRRRALGFWTGVTAYGLVRGIGVRLVTERGLGGRMPYVIHDPVLTIAGVSLQEVMGWAIVAYIGWWIGDRIVGLDMRPQQHAAAARAAGPDVRGGRAPGKHAHGDRGRPERSRGDGEASSGPRLFAVVASAFVFLGAIAWAIESTAVAAGWWHWTVPLTAAPFLDVPLIGLVDWAFVAIDFLLPFLVLTAPASRGSRWRYVSLGAFPLHFVSHLATERIAWWLPVPAFHLAHWTLAGLVLWLALRSDVSDIAFAAPSLTGRSDQRLAASEDRSGRRGSSEEAGRVAPASPTGRAGSSLASGERESLASARPIEARGRIWVEWLPFLVLALILADVAFVQSVRLGRPRLLVSLVPAAVLGLAVVARRAAVGAGLAAAALSLVLPPLLIAALPAALAAFVGASRSLRRRAAVLVLLGLAAIALAVHAAGARRERAVMAGLDAAIAARDRGDLGGADAILVPLCGTSGGSGAEAGAPVGSHAACLLLGEIRYRMGRLDAAAEAFSTAVRIKPDAARAHRYLAVIALARGDAPSARSAAQRGLAVAPTDLELLYLTSRTARTEGRTGDGPAELVWTRAAEAGPEVLKRIAALAFEVGDVEGAADALERGITRWPGDSSLYDLRVRVAIAGDDREGARRVAASWREHVPNDPAAGEAVRRLEERPTDTPP